MSVDLQERTQTTSVKFEGCVEVYECMPRALMPDLLLTVVFPVAVSDGTRRQGFTACPRLLLPDVRRVRHGPLVLLAVAAWLAAIKHVLYQQQQARVIAYTMRVHTCLCYICSVAYNALPV